jgi:CubicO group peptidase (beta-lactamase class C family)
MIIMKSNLKFALLTFLIAIIACKKDKKINFDSLEIEVESATEPLKEFDLSQRMAYYNVPGVSIAVVNNGRIEWAKGYGIANSENGAKVDSETLFQAGSISKPLAAIAALQLVEAGKLELNKDVNLYLKNWTIEENEFTKNEKVTLERLLTHTAGTTVHGFPGYRQNETIPAIAAVLSGQGNTDAVIVDKIPGSLWRYSGGGYTIIEKIIEDVSGLPLEKYMDKNVLSPIGMTNSTYEQPLSDNRQAKASAAYNNNGKIIEGLWHNYPEQAAAGLWTTPSDLAKYCIEIQEILSGKKEGVLSEGIVELMLTKHKNNWGLGPALDKEGDSLTFGHGGKNVGFTNNLVAFAHKGSAVVIMTNGDNGGELINEIQKSIFDTYNW